MPEEPAGVSAGSGRAVRSFLAFDFGTRRVGVAGGNTLLGRAHPLRTVAAEGLARWTAPTQAGPAPDGRRRNRLPAARAWPDR